MQRIEIDTLLETYGFNLWSTERTGRDTREYHYMESRYGINLWVNPDTKEFRMEWIIPHTVFTLKCPKCSPFTNREHFEKMLMRFKKQVRILFEEATYGEQ